MRRRAGHSLVSATGSSRPWCWRATCFQAPPRAQQEENFQHQDHPCLSLSCSPSLSPTVSFPLVLRDEKLQYQSPISIISNLLIFLWHRVRTGRLQRVKCAEPLCIIGTPMCKTKTGRSDFIITKKRKGVPQCLTLL